MTTDPMDLTRKVVSKSIIARSPAGNPVFAFENESQVRQWIKNNPNHRVSFFTQITTEEPFQS